MIGAVALGLLTWAVPQIPVNFVGALLIVIFSFFFVTVSSTIVGLIGSSSNPASGMTIETAITGVGRYAFHDLTGGTGSHQSGVANRRNCII